MNLGKTPIIIIGAGVAGLTIAKTLKTEDYIILEARDRIGGRVLTNSNNLDDGAAWVHGLCENPLTKLLRSDDLISVAECNPWMHSENVNVTYLTKMNDKDRHDKWNKLVNEISLTNSTTTIAEAFSFLSDDDDMRSFLYMIEVWCGGSIRDLPVSFLQQLDYKSALFGDYAGSHCLFKNGAKTLIESLSTGCKYNIICNQIVVKIVYNDCGVEVHTRDGIVYSCNKLCITIPPGPLRDIVFEPPMKPEKIEALSHIKMGSYKKIQLEFDEPFWNNVPMILSRNEENEYILWNNYMISKNMPILEAICPADNGWKMVGKSDEEIVESVMDHLNLYFQNVPFPKA
jgi:monoamine oxidase